MKHLSEKLLLKYGNGWGYEKLKHCVRSAYLFSEEEIGYAVSTQLSWTPKLPDKKLLSEKLQRAIAIAKEHYAEQLDKEEN